MPFEETAVAEESFSRIIRMFDCDTELVRVDMTPPYPSQSEIIESSHILYHPEISPGTIIMIR